MDGTISKALAEHIRKTEDVSMQGWVEAGKGRGSERLGSFLWILTVKKKKKKHAE